MIGTMVHFVFTSTNFCFNPICKYNGDVYSSIVLSISTCHACSFLVRKQFIVYNILFHFPLKDAFLLTLFAGFISFAFMARTGFMLIYLIN